MIDKIVTHIMGSTGTGKTYFAYQEAGKLAKEGSHVLFLSNFDDMQQGALEKRYIKTIVDLQDIFIEGVLMHESYHVIFPRGENGSEQSRELKNNFLLQICHRFETCRGTHLFIDEAQDADEINLVTLLSEAKKYDIKIILIHQYFDQLSKKIQSVLGFYSPKTCIYFQTFGNEVTRILEKYPESGKTVSDIENLKQGEYLVVEK